MLEGLIPARNLAVVFLKSALGFDRVYAARPLVPDTTNEYAVFACPEVPRPFTGVRLVTETYAFDCEIRKAYESTADLLTLQVGLVQSVAGLLTQEWAGEADCYNPRMTEVTFPDALLTDRYYVAQFTLLLDHDVSQ